MDSVNTDVTRSKGKLVSFNLMQYYIKIIKNKFFSLRITIQSEVLISFNTVSARIRPENFFVLYICEYK
jgi:hypothetical protein